MLLSEAVDKGDPHPCVAPYTRQTSAYLGICVAHALKRQLLETHLQCSAVILEWLFRYMSGYLGT
jgi:hypothetical protein